MPPQETSYDDPPIGRDRDRYRFQSDPAQDNPEPPMWEAQGLRVYRVQGRITSAAFAQIMAHAERTGVPVQQADVTMPRTSGSSIVEALRSLVEDEPASMVVFTWKVE
jgi:hypothetical protein